MINSKLFVFLILSLFPLFSFANECSGNKINFDACQYAKEYAEKFSKSLPMKLNNSMSIESVAAIENMILMVVQLRYNRAHIEKLYDSRGLSLSDYKETLSNSLDSMCSGEDPVGAFIRLGGAIRYSYRFSDGEQFLTVTKANCEISVNNNSDLEYRIYQNKRFGFKVSYPKDLFTAMGESDNEDGQVFLNRQDNAKITSYGTPNTSSCDINKIQDDELDVSYLRKIDNTVIYSGTKKGIVVYKKAIKSNDACLMVDIRYPISKKELYDDIADKVAKSFSPSQREFERGIQQAEIFLNAIKDKDFEEVYSKLLADDGKISTVEVGQISFSNLEEFKAVYDDIFTESFIELIDSGLKPECCVGGANYGYENRVYWGNKDLNVVFFFGKDGYTDDDHRQVLKLTNKLIPSPSFSCQKSQGLDEETICDDVKLSELDQKLADIYEDAKRYLTRSNYENLVPAQRSFIEKRKNCETDRKCLANKMQGRIAELNLLIKNEVRELEEKEISIDAVGKSMSGRWEKDKIVNTRGVNSHSEEVRHDNAQFRVSMDWPTALFEYQIGRNDATKITVTQTCALKDFTTETLAQAHDDSSPGWGSGGGSFDWLGMQGYYFVLEFQDELLNDCGYLVISGRPSSGFELFLVRPNIENINFIKPSVSGYSSAGDVFVSMYGVGSFASRTQGDGLLGLPNAAIKMKRKR